MIEQTATIISKETVVEGVTHTKHGQIDVYGMINGELEVNNLVIHEGGKVVGTVRAQNILAHGLLQGEIRVEGLLDIRDTGSVHGEIVYKALVLIEGGELSADVKNIAPTLAGDMKISVSNGKTVRLTPNDLTAIDPDDHAKDLQFSVSNMRNGIVARVDKPGIATTRFTQEELEKGTIAFVHNGKQGPSASFSVSVSDAAGASSGAPRTVEVEVRH